MLGLSALVIVLLGSISFKPDTPEQALTGSGNLLKKFAIIFPDKGQSKAPTFIQNVQYSATNIEQSAGNSVAFTLNVSWGNQFFGDGENKEKDKGPPPSVDPFRYAVYTFHQPPGRKVENPFARGRPKAKATAELELVEPPPAT